MFSSFENIKSMSLILVILIEIRYVRSEESITKLIHGLFSGLSKLYLVIRPNFFIWIQVNQKTSIIVM